MSVALLAQVDRRWIVAPENGVLIKANETESFTRQTVKHSHDGHKFYVHGS